MVTEDASTVRTERVTTVRILARHPRARVALAAVGLVLIVSGLAFFTLDRVGQIAKRQLASVLQVTLNAATEGVRAWLKDAERTADSAAQDPEAKSLLASCVVHGEDCRSAELVALLDPYLRAGGFARFSIVDDAGELRVGDPRLPRIGAALGARRGLHAVVLSPVLEAGRAMMPVVVPIAGAKGGGVGALCFDLPADGFGSILRAARAGDSGETYAFDARGRLLSDSRFVAQLRRAGLLASTAPSAALVLELRDPGGDLTRGFIARPPRAEQPLDRMASAALAGHSGIDVEGYRDYRGVPVVGAWEWLPELQMGIATEIDVDEARRTPNELRRIFAWLIAALVIAAASLLAAMAVTARLRARAQHAEKLAARFGQYRIVRTIGEGGMGTVYLASHELLRRPAAVKLLRPDRATPDAIERFEREVRLTSTLTHPNTVAVYDYGRDEKGTFYYAMEYLEGLDLQTLVARFGPLPVGRVIHFLSQVCGSLTEAHGAGLIHRDIKPANLVVCTRGGVVDTLKVLDFGVVMSIKSERVSSTKDQLLLGTPEYMAPEMFESADQANVHSDLYALGAVGYFLLTGAPPFEGHGLSELRMAHLTRAPEPLGARLGSSPDAVLEAALLACLAKRRERRPSSATALRAMLDRSPLARAWTRVDAEAWWAARAEEITALRAAAATSDSTPSLRRIRPATQA